MAEFPLLRIADLVAQLGAPWHLVPEPHNQDDRRAYVTNGRGKSFYLTADWRQLHRDEEPERWRITVSGEYPTYPGSYYTGDAPRPTFDLSRPLDQLAKDIQRRFMPGFEKCWQDAVERKHRYAVRLARREQLAAALLTAHPGTPGHRGHPGSYVYDKSDDRLSVRLELEDSSGAFGTYAMATVRLDGAAERVRVELDYITPEDLMEMLRLFKAAKAAQWLAGAGPDLAVPLAA